MRDTDICVGDVLIVASPEEHLKAASKYGMPKEWVNHMSQLSGKTFTVLRYVDCWFPDLGKEVRCYDSYEGVERIFGDGAQSMVIVSENLCPLFPIKDSCRQNGGKIKQLFHD